ncbi:MAG: heavy metal translocating P-type ATPase, partial [Gammaproteobacteria bacterium]|nr:heavy metal translocating P-type ATPase [Gammaproteobacteria bacterium]
MNIAVTPVDQQHAQVRVGGMTCGACAVRLEKALGRAAGISLAEVNFATEQASVDYDPKATDVENIVQAIINAGFEAENLPEAGDRAAFDAEHEAQQSRQLRLELISLICSVLLTAPLVGQMAAMVAGWHFHLPPLVELLLATPVQFVIGARFYRGAWHSLRAGAGNMDVLVVMGTTTAFLYSVYLLITLGPNAFGQLYFEASAVIITLVLLGKYMEAKAKRGTTAAIRQLMDLRPETARLLRGGQTVDVPVDQVRSDDHVIIRPGERVPVDGKVLDGLSEMDESLLTGESLPVNKLPGDTVTGGAINGTGLLTVQATMVGEDSTLSRIIRMVENAQSGKAPVQRLVDKISAVFVPSVVVIAALTFVVQFFMSNGFESALIAAVSVLVIACPCALGLATPTAIMTGTGSAARAGILIKDVAALERAHRLNAIIFDKTGTLTEGRPAVVFIQSVAGDESDLLLKAASLQQGSEHPLGRAMLERAEQKTLSLLPISDFKSHTGFGVEANINAEHVMAGNEALMLQQGIDLPDELRSAALLL